jgi:uncharacterized protein YndB with AHSA1/START domain
MPSETLTFERTVNATPAQVYRAFTNSTALREWFCDAALADARPQGRVYFGWNSGYYASGAYTELKENELVAFTWCGRGEPASTQVQVALHAADVGTRVAISHNGIGSGEAWAEATQEFRRGWEAGLENLTSVIESGEDLRYTRRPMLGIMVGEFNAAVAAELKVPVTEGIRLDGVIEGMGAASAGLQKDDVITSIAGAEVTAYPTLTGALQRHRADDRVEVVFYRGAEKKSTTMVLSRRPLPEVPPTAKALSQAVHKLHAEADAELELFLAGVSETEASYHPAPDEWNVKEILAHLITGERFQHNWITDLISDFEPWYDGYGGNVTARNQALVAAYPTVSELLEELKCNETETVALLAALPPEFIARKGTFTRLSYAMLETPGYHTRQHLEQMRAAIEAARKSQVP